MMATIKAAYIGQARRVKQKLWRQHFQNINSPGGLPVVSMCPYPVKIT